MPVLRFPDDFLWGTATASYQIEGSPLADGAGTSIWHSFAHESGRIRDGDNGDVACDHFNRYRDDVALMGELGLRAYRFSLSWSRWLPGGHGPVNEAGADYYDRLVDSLLEAGVEPMVTLYHWDLPQALEDAGGWPEPGTAERYADYAQIAFERLGDRVKRWITMNEPWVFTYLGYGLGIHAPGRTDLRDALAAGKTVLRAHGSAVSRFREAVPDGEIGITLSVQAQVPATDSLADKEAARCASAFHNEWFIEPIVYGRYPAALEEQFGDDLSPLAEHADEISQRIDFIGLNYYTRAVVAWDEEGFFHARPVRRVGRYTAMDWEVYPAGLYELLKTFWHRYRLPLYVTENGAGFEDEIADDSGFVHDHERLRYLQSHFEMTHRAIADGVDVRGYMVWSFLDNFEWSFGFSKRFGIVRCDYETQERIPKLSARWYSEIIAENGI